MVQMYWTQTVIDNKHYMYYNKINCMPYLKNKRGCSVIRTGAIACDLITRIVMLVINRAIEPLHVLLTVLSNMHLKLTIKAELGILIRMCEAKARNKEVVTLENGLIMNSALTENWVECMRSILNFCLGMSKYLWRKVSRGHTLKINCMPYLKNKRGCSKIHTGVIACDLITRIVMLVINRAIEPLYSSLI